VLYRGTQSFFRETVPGGMEALVATMGPGPLADFISQSFMASSWYNVMPVPQLIEAEARTCKQPLDEYLLHRTRWQSQQDLNGVYRFLLKLISPEHVVERLPTLLTRMFDFPTLAVEKPAERERLAHFGNIPVVLDAWLRQAFSVYIDAILKHAGAQAVDVGFTSGRDPATVSGIPVETLTCRIVWR
jgi:hypothetical protein